MQPSDMPAIYSTPALPNAWIIRNATGAYLVGPHRTGWRERRPYRGNYTLTAVEGPATCRAVLALCGYKEETECQS